MKSNFIPIYSLIRKQTIRLFRIAGQNLLTPIINASLYLLIFGFGVGSYIPMTGAVTYASFVIPGLIIMGTINSSFMDPSFTIMLARIWGDIEDLKVVPMKPYQIVLGLSLAGVLRGVIVAIGIFIAAELIIYFNTYSFLIPSHIGATVLLLILSCWTFSLFGVSAGFVSHTFEILNSLMWFILAPLIYLGGVFYSFSHLSPIWKKFALFDPLFYYINGFRYAFISKADTSLENALIMTTLFFVFSFCLAIFTVTRVSFRRN